MEILHRAQMGQDVYIYGIRTYHIYIYIYIYIDNFPFSPQVWGSLRSPQLGVCMRMMPRAAQTPYAHGARGEGVRRFLFSGSPKSSTKQR